MDPFSRGKRILEMSLSSQKFGCPPSKRQRPLIELNGPPPSEQTPSILDISMSKLMDLPSDMDLSITSDIMDEVPSICSTLKVAHYIMDHCAGDDDNYVNDVNDDMGEVIGCVNVDGQEVIGCVNVDGQEVIGCANVDGQEVIGCVNVDGQEVIGCVNVDGQEVIGCVNVDGQEVIGCVNVDGQEVIGCVNVDGQEVIGCVNVDGQEVIGCANVDGQEVIGCVNIDGQEAIGSTNVDGQEAIGSTNVDGQEVIGCMNVDGEDVIGRVNDGNFYAEVNGHADVDGEDVIGRVNIDGEDVIGCVNVDGEDIIERVNDENIDEEEVSGRADGTGDDVIERVNDGNLDEEEIIGHVNDVIIGEDEGNVNNRSNCNSKDITGNMNNVIANEEEVNGYVNRADGTGVDVIGNVVNGNGITEQVIGNLHVVNSSGEQLTDHVDEANVNLRGTGPRQALTKKERNKQRREQGQSYRGRYFDKEQSKFVEVDKEERKLGPRCSCKASFYQCKDISDEERATIYQSVWKLSWNEKRIYVKMSVDTEEVKERRPTWGPIRRNNTFLFYLKGSGDRRRVCREMFLQTTGLKKWWIQDTLKKLAGTSDDVQTTQKNRTVSDGVTFIREFLGRLPRMPSHYCRKDTAKSYLEPSFQTLADLYREYVSTCQAESKVKMSRNVFITELKSQNISIFHPRKDQCDTCVEFTQGNITQEKYTNHRERKEAAQAEKEKDKRDHPQNSRTKVLCVDVQRVLLAPSLKASALYYKTKLQIHNYTVFDLASKDVTCFIWNETEGGLNASEFASCLVNYLESKEESFDKVIIFSDGCTYQNRNRVLATALRYFCVKHGKCVEQKILERGHTQMEVDSVHATIERKLKNRDIFSPTDYFQIIRAARTNPRPYEVKTLNHTFFMDYDNFGKGAVKSIKPSKTENVTDMCALKYNPDGSLAYKLRFSEEWQELSLGRQSCLPESGPNNKFTARRKIKKSKFQHLQSLKSVLPAEVHPFYDALPYL